MVGMRGKILRSKSDTFIFVARYNTKKLKVTLKKTGRNYRIVGRSQYTYITIIFYNLFQNITFPEDESQRISVSDPR